MGNSTSQRDARSLREILDGLDRVEQHRVAVEWARENNRAIDMFGDFAREHHLVLFQSGNECENWLDPIDNILYKMNTLTHVGENLGKLFTRVEIFNSLFPLLALKFIGFQVMSETSVFPVFAQTFVSGARMATSQEIVSYMHSIGFEPTDDCGRFSNGKYFLWDIKPKNVLITPTGECAVIDAEIDIC